MAEPRNIETLYRLTPLQEGILFHTLERDDPALYVGQYTAVIDADVDVERLRLVWFELTRRHAALRTLFTWKGRDKPLQIVRKDVEVPWRYEDWSGDDDAESPERWRALAQAEREQGFDLGRTPVYRLALVRVDERRYRFSFCYHHIILDGWSLKLLLDEAAALYVKPAGCELTDTRYADYVDWLLTRDTGDEKTFWASQLGDLETPTRIPFTSARDATGHASRELLLDAAEANRIRAAARDHRSTSGTLMMAAWALLLSRYTDSDDVVFGTTWAGRPQQLPGCQQTVGLFINTLPTRVQVSDNETAGSYIARVQELLVCIRQHEHTPLLTAQRASAVPPGQALFDSLVVLQSVPETGPSSRPWTPVDETFFEYSNYPVALLLRPGENFSVSLVYDQARVDAGAAERLLEHYINLVRGIVTAPGTAVGELAMLSNKEDEWLRAAGTGARLDPGQTVAVHRQMFDCAPGSPDEPAIIQDDRALSYAELASRSNDVACSVRKVLVDGGHSTASGFRGAVFLDRTPAALLGIFGVLAAGGSYVPMDPAHPARRSRMVLEDLAAGEAPAVIVTERRFLPDLPASDLPVVCIDAIEPAAATPPAGTAGDAYVMYTSGSAGRPKGVCVTHANLVASTAARDVYYGETPRRFLLLSSLATDSSIAGIFWTLTRTGTLVLPRPREEQSVASIAAIIRQQRITHMLCLPSLYALLLEHAEAGALESLTSVIVAGEACPATLVAAHHQCLPSVTLFNEYGPSEATVWATAARMERETTEVTIGRPVAGVYTRVVDRRGRRVPTGVPGELWIGGAGVARGYLGQPALTESRFVSDPEDDGSRMYRSGDRVCQAADGELRFLGRVDTQLKIRGHRVEPEEIEQRLTAVEGIRDAAVLAAAGANGGDRLIAFIVCRDEVPSLSALREELGGSLPDFMLPNVVTAVDALPRLPGGKVDLEALRARVCDADAGPGSDHAAPTTDGEALLAGIWADALGIDAVGIHDNYFELGGDSLLSIRILARAQKAGLEISPTEFFARPTVAEQAVVARRADKPAASVKTPKPKRAPFQLANLDADALAAVARQLGDDD